MSRSQTPLSDDDYGAIEAAVMETSRGRWFLAEYARRNRTADTLTLLEAIGRLERFATIDRAAPAMERIRTDLVEMADAIVRTKAEIAALRPNEAVQSHFEEATEVLDAVVRTTEGATSDILEAAEHIQEAAWTLRELDGADAVLCDELDRRATDIYTSCSFQDITAQRTNKVVQVLRYLEGRINALIDVWSQPNAGAAIERAALALPVLAKDGLSQDDVDTVILQSPADVVESHARLSTDRSPLGDTDLVFVERDRAIEAALPVGHQADDAARLEAETKRRDAFASIDALDIEEKLRRFS